MNGVLQHPPPSCNRRTVAPGLAWGKIAWGDGTYVAVGDRGAVLLSEDGREWRIRRTSDPGDFRAVTFGNHTFIAVNRNAIWSRHGE